MNAGFKAVSRSSFAALAVLAVAACAPSGVSYNKDVQPPKELLVPTPLGEAALIESWLSEKKGEAVKIVAPERGLKHGLGVVRTVVALDDGACFNEVERQLNYPTVVGVAASFTRCLQHAGERHGVGAGGRRC